MALQTPPLWVEEAKDEYMSRSADPDAKIRIAVEAAHKAGMPPGAIKSMVENMKERQRAALNKCPQPVALNLPDWAMKPDPSNFERVFSLMGLLLVRCLRLTQPVMGSAVNGKFGVGRVGVVDALECLDNDGADAVAVFLMVGGKPMHVFDDPLLFPSDGLITKIVTLSDAAKGK